METLKYKIIASKSQYKEYCNQLEQLIAVKPQDRNTKDEIALLTLLIEKWDAEHSSFTALNPIQLLQSFIKDHKIKAKDLVSILGISKGYVSDILNYKKGLSKEVITQI
jgi:HTH-type transcriptional regulator/antitoxin HigA